MAVTEAELGGEFSDEAARIHDLSFVQAEIYALVGLIANEPQEHVRLILSSQLDEALMSMQTDLQTHTGPIQINFGVDKPVLDVPRDKITGISLLPGRNVDWAFVPTVDMRIITKQDRADAEARGGKTLGSWRTFMIGQTVFTLLPEASA